MSFTRRLWYRWKALKLPWRTQTLIGADLSGNTFWEFQDQLNANRLRRIVKYSAKAHYADIKISRESRPVINTTANNHHTGACPVNGT